MDDKQMEEFEKYAEYAERSGIRDSRDKNVAWFAWNARQQEIDALKRELTETKEVEIKACNLAAELDVKNTELEKDSDDPHEQIMRLRILLEEAEGVIRLYAPGHSILLENIEVALYGEKLAKEGGEE